MSSHSQKKLALFSLFVVSSSALFFHVGWTQEGRAKMEDGMPPTASPQEVTDMETVKSRFIAGLIVTKPKEAQALTKDATQLRDTLGADGKWTNLMYAYTGPGEWGPSHHLDNVLVMTRAYATPGQPLYGDADLRRKIDLGLDTFFAGKYLNANWWYNDIGVPNKVGPILLLLPDISLERREQGLALLKRSADDKPMRKSTGANLSWLARIQLMRALVISSPTLVNEAFDVMWSEIKISPQSADGIQADYSFHQHGPLIYNGGYGTSFVNDTITSYSYAQGTRFALKPDKEHILVNFLLDGQDWMAYGGNFDPGVRGRDITREGGGSPSQWRHIAEVLAQNTNYRRGELLDMAHRQDTNGKKLMGNRHFWDSDFMVQHRQGYYTSVRMHSTRTRNTDGASKLGGPINREGRQSHHVADGATYLFRRGDEYDGIAPVWNWQLIPGTTAEQLPTLNEERVAFLGGSSFVGGVSDGRYGAAAMDLNRDGLSAKKAWFYFDDEFVALGAGISNTSLRPVLTSVNQSLLRGDVHLSNQEGALPEGDREESGVRWVLHDSIGYIFPQDTKPHVANQMRSGHWSDVGTGSNALVSKGVFTLYLEHGLHPMNATYEYVVVPNANERNLNARITYPAVQTLANTPDLQAVRHNGLKITEAVFRKAGELSDGAGERLKVDQSCLVLLKEVGREVQISVCNPENKALTVNIELNRKLVGEGTTLQGENTNVRFELPDGLFAGSSIIRTLK